MPISCLQDHSRAWETHTDMWELKAHRKARGVKGNSECEKVQENERHTQTLKLKGRYNNEKGWTWAEFKINGINQKMISNIIDDHKPVAGSELRTNLFSFMWSHSKSRIMFSRKLTDQGEKNFHSAFHILRASQNALQPENYFLKCGLCSNVRNKAASLCTASPDK